MDTEKNRVKVSKYRTRKGLKEAGYTPDEIAAILERVNWAVSTPQDILAQYVGYEETEQSIPRVPRTAQVEQPPAPGLGLSDVIAVSLAGTVLAAMFAVPYIIARLARQG